jgi:DMSO/TMAO reductase YedYZ molybdopterin-dependent catalytic subunit
LSSQSHPFFNPAKPPLTDGGFSRDEIRLANRNPGTLLESLRYDLTPAGLHYLLVHFDVPFVESCEDWTLKISGLVGKSIELTVNEIKQRPQHSIPVTLECAGNGRAEVSPRYQSQPWHHEAVGTAQWTGTPLKNLLDEVGFSDAAVDVVFYGADRGFAGGKEHDYGRSLSPEHALADDVLVAWAMNDAPLLPQHGFPLRLIVPGWFGMASVKWLNRIEVIGRAFDGHQQVGAYVYRESADDPGTPVTTLRVKSLMVPPGLPDVYTRDRLAEKGPVTLTGRAWSGAGATIRKVEVAVGGQWLEATLDAPLGQYAWRGWKFDWQASVGEHELMCRATDSNGDVQPLEPRFDLSGMGNNAVHRVNVTVR